MKLIELINNIDKSDKNSSWVDFSHVMSELSMSYYSLGDAFHQQTRLKAYWLWKRYDTDTYVGIEAFFLDDEFVFLNTTTGRKNGDGDIEFKDKASKDKVFAYLLTLMEDDEDQCSYIDNLDEDMGFGAPVFYSSELLTDNLLNKNGDKFLVTETYSRDKDSDKWSLVKVKDEQGKEQVVELDELLVPYCLST